MAKYFQHAGVMHNEGKAVMSSMQPDVESPAEDKAEGMEEPMMAPKKAFSPKQLAAQAKFAAMHKKGGK